MRNSPTPSTGRLDGRAGGVAVGHVGEEPDRLAVGRPPGPGPRLQGGPLLDVGRDPTLGLGLVGVDLDHAGGAVDEQPAAARDVERARGADHARDAELAGDDRGVAGRAAALGDQREHPLGVEAGGVGRRQVGGDEHARLLGHGYAGLGLADDPGHHPALDVAQVGDPLGHQPAHAGEHGDERLDRGLQRGQQVVARLQLLEHRGPQPLVAGEPGAGGQHLGGCAGGLAAPWRRTRRTTWPATSS